MIDIMEVKQDLETTLGVLNHIVGDGNGHTPTAASPVTSTTRRRHMAPETKAKIAAAARERWARVRREKKTTSKK